MFAASIKQGLRGSAFSIGALLLSFIVLSFFYVKTSYTATFPDLFYTYFSSPFKSVWLITLFNLVCLFSALGLINLLINVHELSDKMNFFPVFLYAFWAALSLTPYQLSKELFINCLVLFAWYKLLNTYRNEKCLSDLFLAAFCLSLTLFLSVACWVYIPVFFVSVVILKPLTVREILLALLGFLCPLFIFECLAYLSDFQQWYLLEMFPLYLSTLHLPNPTRYEWLLLGFVLVLLIFSFIQFILNPHSTKVKTAKGKTSLGWCLLGSLLIAAGASGQSISALLYTLIPVSFICGDYFFYVRRLLFVNLWLSLVLITGFLVVLSKLGLLL